jgi:TRAP-type mannitol/chloroaromatic compound transport system permease small subunit
MNFFDRVTRLTEFITIKFFYIMFLTVIVNIILRYLFNINYIFLQELVMYMHAFIFLFGVSICLKEDTHVRIDIFSSKLSVVYRKLIDQIGLIIFIIPFCLFVIYESTSMIKRSWVMLEGSSEPGGLPIVFILKSSIYLFSFLILLQAVNKFFDKR